MIVGLGNPGSEYARTRHNAGFMALDRLKNRYASGAVARSRFGGLAVEAVLPPSEPGRGDGPGAEEKCLLLKPLTYMNLSGQSVGEAVRFYKLDPEQDVLVLVDDVALGLGKVRVRAMGSAGGHNGLADIERVLGTRRYARCRIGIDAPPPGGIRQRDYVLGRFTDEQMAELERAGGGLDRACEASRAWATRGVMCAMDRFNADEPSGASGDRHNSNDNGAPGAGA